MAQSTDLVVPNTSGAGVRSGINTRLQAIATHQSGATAPTTTYAYQFWADTTAGLLKQRDGSNANWISLGTLGGVNLGHAPLASPTFTGTVTIPAGASISGYAPLASPTFTGTVTIPTGASISGFAPLASPNLTGTPSAPTAAAGTSTTQLATTAFVQANGAVKAWVNFNGATYTNLSGTYSQSGTTVTVTATAHGIPNATTVFSSITTGTAVSGTYNVTAVLNANTFTYTAGTALTTSGSVTLVRNTIRASFNVSSITDNGVGDYTINFATGLADANYATIGSLGDLQNTTPPVGGTLDDHVFLAEFQAVGFVRVWSTNANGSPRDPACVSVAVFR